MRRFIATIALVGFTLGLTAVVAEGQEASQAQKLTIANAERIANANHPRITIAQLQELIEREGVREVRAPELPQAAAYLTAVDAEDNSRITAGLLNNPTLYSRAAAGLTVSQLITDFGRTHHLVKSAQLTDEARKSALTATQEEVRLVVDRAFLQALIEQRLQQIAEQTVAARQTLDDEVTALTRAKLKSTLDQSIADTELSVAELHLVDAQTDACNAMFDLEELLGISGGTEIVLVDGDDSLEMPLNLDAQQLIVQAYHNRPDLAVLLREEAAAYQLKLAEHNLERPTIQAMAVAGDAPVRADGIAKAWYGAAGVNISIPLLNGARFSARAMEADLAEQQAHARIVEQRQLIERDLRKTLANAQAAYQKIAVTEQILEQANLALELATTRYKLGLSNMVELNDAQNAQIAAQIGAANARYSYRIWSAELRFQTGE
jgi:outer membrane protein